MSSMEAERTLDLMGLSKPESKVGHLGSAFEHVGLAYPVAVLGAGILAVEGMRRMVAGKRKKGK